MLYLHRKHNKYLYKKYLKVRMSDILFGQERIKISITDQMSSDHFRAMQEEWIIKNGDRLIRAKCPKR